MEVDSGLMGGSEISTKIRGSSGGIWNWGGRGKEDYYPSSWAPPGLGTRESGTWPNVVENVYSSGNWQFRRRKLNITYPLDVGTALLLKTFVSTPISFGKASRMAVGDSKWIRYSPFSHDRYIIVKYSLNMHPVPEELGKTAQIIARQVREVDFSGYVWKCRDHMILGPYRIGHILKRRS